MILILDLEYDNDKAISIRLQKSEKTIF